jgi:hypothetical protein
MIGAKQLAGFLPIYFSFLKGAYRAMNSFLAIFRIT